MDDHTEGIIVDHGKPQNIVRAFCFLAFAIISQVYFYVAFVLRFAPLASVFFVMIGAVQIFVLVWFSWWYIATLFHRTPAIIVTQEGIYHLAEPWSPGLILWSEIGNVRIIKSRFEKAIILQLHRPNGITSRQKTKLRRLVMRITYGRALQVPIYLSVLPKAMLASVLSHVQEDSRTPSALPKESVQ